MFLVLFLIHAYAETNVQKNFVKVDPNKTYTATEVQELLCKRGCLADGNTDAKYYPEDNSCGCIPEKVKMEEFTKEVTKVPNGKTGSFKIHTPEKKTQTSYLPTWYTPSSNDKDDDE